MCNCLHSSVARASTKSVEWIRILVNKKVKKKGVHTGIKLLLSDGADDKEKKKTGQHLLLNLVLYEYLRGVTNRA